MISHVQPGRVVLNPQVNRTAQGPRNAEVVPLMAVSAETNYMGSSWSTPAPTYVDVARQTATRLHAIPDSCACSSASPPPSVIPRHALV